MRFRSQKKNNFENLFDTYITWRWKEVWRDDTEIREVLLSSLTVTRCYIVLSLHVTLSINTNV